MNRLKYLLFGSVAVTVAFFVFRKKQPTPGQVRRIDNLQSEIIALFAKNGYDLRWYILHNRKLTIPQIDSVLRKLPREAWADEKLMPFGGVKVTMKMFYKNVLLESGLMPFGITPISSATKCAAISFIKELTEER